MNSFNKDFNRYCLEKNIIAEFTRFHPLIKNHKLKNLNQEVFFDRKTVYINLERDIEEIIRVYKKSTRQEYRWTLNKYNLT